MMREYARVSPRFWTGKTGHWLREQGRDLQVLALYLITCPNANMIGLYYLPLLIIAHETGLPMHGIKKGLQRLAEGGFAHYDQTSEIVWVPAMVRFQIGETVKQDDKRAKGILRELLQVQTCPFAKDFFEKYRTVYHLDAVLEAKGLASPFEGPSKGCEVSQKALARTIPQEQEHAHAHEQAQEGSGEESARKRAGAPPQVTPEEIKSKWDRIPGVKPCKVLGATIASRIRTRLKEHPDPAWWEDLFRQVHASDWLCGRTNGSRGPFQATLDWVLSPKNLDKILAGNYDNGGSRHAPQTCQSRILYPGEQFIRPCGKPAKGYGPGNKPLCADHLKEREHDRHAQSAST